MALYAFDGTGNRDEAADEDDSHITRLFQEYYQGQNKVYLEGIATQDFLPIRIVQGLTGAGSRSQIRGMREQFDVIYNHPEQADKVIDIIGYSRGAATAVCFANILAKEGKKVRFLGLFDCVASFGIPGDNLNIGWDIEELNPNIAYVAHALSLDERRRFFPLTRPKAIDPTKTKINECWLRGVHSDIGGSAKIDLTSIDPDNEIVGLTSKSRTNVSLQWMLQQAELVGVEFDYSNLSLLVNSASALAPISVNLDPKRDSLSKTRRPRVDNQFHPTVNHSELELGESRVARCYAQVQYNPSGIQLRAGQSYKFTVDPNRQWYDGDQVCNAGGWNTQQADNLNYFQKLGIKLSRRNRRSPDVNWFFLVGSIGDEEPAKNSDNDAQNRINIGLGLANYQATSSGEFYTFANDLNYHVLLDFVSKNAMKDGGFYKNHRGYIDVNVTRVS